MEKYVVTLDLARGLKEAGYPQDTYWFIRYQKPTGHTKLYWKGDMDYDNERFSGDRPEHVRFREENEFFAAPMADELLEQLPYMIDTRDVRGSSQLVIEKLSNEFYVCYAKPELGKFHEIDNHGVVSHGYHDTLPGALAYRWLWLRDNGYALPCGINQSRPS